MIGGRLRHQVRFERRTTVDDGYGNAMGPWAPLVTVWAGFKPRFGREAMESGQLESTMLGVLSVRRSPDAAAITPADRVVFLSGELSGKAMNIRSIVPLHDAIEMVLEEGVAT